MLEPCARKPASTVLRGGRRCNAPPLPDDPGAVGIKSGYTDGAGHCLLFDAVRNGRALIGVVLDSPATGPAAAAQDAERMLNWGFRLPRAG